jgi:uncharacterized membrane protein YebE (DUF533 family)
MNLKKILMYGAIAYGVYWLWQQQQAKAAALKLLPAPVSSPPLPQPIMSAGMSYPETTS